MIDIPIKYLNPDVSHLEVDEVIAFLRSLNHDEKERFRGFLQGVRFMKEMADSDPSSAP